MLAIMKHALNDRRAILVRKRGTETGKKSEGGRGLSSRVVDRDRTKPFREEKKKRKEKSRERGPSLDRSKKNGEH